MHNTNTNAHREQRPPIATFARAVVAAIGLALLAVPSSTAQAQSPIGSHVTMVRHLGLYENHPNPFTTSTEIRFWLNRPMTITVSLFNISGERVSRLVNQSYEKGDHSVRWDGTDDAGKPVPNGTYVCQLEADGEVDSRTIMVVR